MQGSVQAIFVTFLTKKKKKNIDSLNICQFTALPQNKNSHDLSQPHAIPEVYDFVRFFLKDILVL